MEIDHYNIEKYIQGELAGNELMEFEVLLEKDEALLKKVLFYQYSMSILSKNQASKEVGEDKLAKINPILDELRDKHFIYKTAKTEIPQEETEPKPTIIKRLLPFTALAVAAALLIFLFLPQLQNKSNLEIAEHNFEPYPLSTNRMGNGGDADKLFKDAQRNYNNGNFEEANKKFDAFLKEKPKAPEVWLAKGSSAFALNKINVAINSFKKVIKIDDGGINHPNANWYLALCYLKKDESEKAIYHLKKIKEGADNYVEAKQLLQLLE